MYTLILLYYVVCGLCAVWTRGAGSFAFCVGAVLWYCWTLQSPNSIPNKHLILLLFRCCFHHHQQLEVIAAGASPAVFWPNTAHFHQTNIVWFKSSIQVGWSKFTHKLLSGSKFVQKTPNHRRLPDAIIVGPRHETRLIVPPIVHWEIVVKSR
jgi:hypothetical protein